MRNRIMIITILLAGAGLLQAQDNYRLNAGNSRIVVEGTSNLHDWEMEASGMQAKLMINKSDNGLEKITGVEFEMPAEKLKSNSNIMDKKTREALRSSKYENIRFELTGATSPLVTGNRFRGSATGYLHIAGTTRKATIPFEGVLSGERLTVSGKVSIYLPEYNISPPTALLGSLKTGEKVDVEYRFEFIPAESYTQIIH
ncbi:MAG: YceI family protein [Bacteroidales bacterium]|nr:YceI family protein [Bacteroidales bacterium]